LGHLRSVDVEQPIADRRNKLDALAECFKITLDRNPD
jgi:hypothetical protein